ncbi:hypothetical protein H5410_039744 [Solanum commersonii]|uniref:Uncharacterized protein n=1 Tax=Solanum commersonii TaxID=4109 RepID=A0A9J5XQH7_SOLCO|nr:hypothetical protein H5410_039744 [Solanum commersonii]
MGKGERWGSRTNGVTGIGTSTGVIKGNALRLSAQTRGDRPCRYMDLASPPWVMNSRYSDIYFARTKNPNPSPDDFRFVYPWL